MQDFRQLSVWRKGHQLTLDIYRVSTSFPIEERFGITSQIRRASISIPNNIAEGCGRDGDMEVARFLQIVLGSASEVEYLLLLAKDLDYLNDDEYEALNARVVEIKRMLTGFIKRLRC